MRRARGEAVKIAYRNEDGYASLEGDYIRYCSGTLPISSSGHLVILKEIMHIDLEGGGLFFDVMLHFGTLFAIFVAFRHDILKMIVEGLHIVGDAFATIV